MGLFAFDRELRPTVLENLTNIILAALGFVIIVFGLGVIMRGGCAGGEDRRAAAKKIVEALDRTNRADRALEAGNYGDARQQVKRL